MLLIENYHLLTKEWTYPQQIDSFNCLLRGKRGQKQTRMNISFANQYLFFCFYNHLQTNT